MALAALAHRPPAAAQHLGRARHRVAKRRNQAEQQARCERDDQRKRECPAVDLDLGQSRQRRRTCRDEEAEPEPCEAETDHTAGETEHDAFEQELACDSIPPGPERGADAELVSPAFGSDQEQIGNVGTRDDEHETDHRHQDPQNLADAADDVLFVRMQRRADPGAYEQRLVHAERRRPGLEPDRQHPGDVCVRGAERDAVAKPRNAPIVEFAERHLRRIESRRQHELGAVEQREALRHDADHGVLRGVHFEPTADDRGISAELTLPEAVTEDHGLLGARGIVVAGEPATEQRGDTQRIERPVSHDERPDQLRVADAGHSRAAIRPDAEMLERLVLVSIGEVHAR